MRVDILDDNTVIVFVGGFNLRDPIVKILDVVECWDDYDDYVSDYWDTAECIGDGVLWCAFYKTVKEYQKWK